MADDGRVKRIEGEFRAMRAVIRALASHLPNITPAGRQWLRAQLLAMLDDDVGAG